MNLIEQLGGYNAAKAEANASVKLMNSFSYDQLEKELLEYRRENGIFEEGDKIIFSAMCKSVVDFNECLNMFLSQGLIRHATDAEIKVGYRL